MAARILAVSIVAAMLSGAWWLAAHRQSDESLGAPVHARVDVPATTAGESDAGYSSSQHALQNVSASEASVAALVPPQGRQVISNPSALAAIADPIEAMVTPTSTDDAAWLDEHGWPTTNDLQQALDPTIECGKRDLTTMLDDNRCAAALWQRHAPDDAERLETIAGRGSAFAARLRLMNELRKPVGEQNTDIIRRMVLDGIMVGDRGIERMLGNRPPFGYYLYEIAGAQESMASANASQISAGGRPMTFRQRPNVVVTATPVADGWVPPTPRSP
jgi:hypothetical protein